jgi:DNA polymerase I-like protein with 3'-5' exonuclease and polymerase domains
MQWFNKGIDAVTTSDRNTTKKLVYGIMYGMGSRKLAQDLGTFVAISGQELEKLLFCAYRHPRD